MHSILSHCFNFLCNSLSSLNIIPYNIVVYLAPLGMWVLLKSKGFCLLCSMLLNSDHRSTQSTAGTKEWTDLRVPYHMCPASWESPSLYKMTSQKFFFFFIQICCLQKPLCHNGLNDEKLEEVSKPRDVFLVFNEWRRGKQNVQNQRSQNKPTVNKKCF